MCGSFGMVNGANSSRIKTLEIILKSEKVLQFDCSYSLARKRNLLLRQASNLFTSCYHPLTQSTSSISTTHNGPARNMSDLDAIRAQRLAQLRGQQGGGSSPGFQLPAGMTPQGGPGQAEEDSAAKAQAQAQEEEMRRTLMGQILAPDARERRMSNVPP